MSKPWKTLRAIVEVRVPCDSPHTEKHFKYAVEEAINAHTPFKSMPSNVRVKSFTRAMQGRTPAKLMNLD